MTAETPHADWNMNPLEALLLSLEQQPWDAAYRVALGFVVIPAFTWLSGSTASDWLLIAFFLGLLTLQRLLPAACRRAFPFSEALRREWAARRQMAKYYDSYQWRKLVWVGLGLGVYLLISGQVSPVRLTLTWVCTGCGGAGLAVWLLRGRYEA
jgi:hypothetical protein